MPSSRYCAFPAGPVQVALLFFVSCTSRRSRHHQINGSHPPKRRIRYSFGRDGIDVTTTSVSEQQVESLASRYGIKLPSISTDDDDSSTKENVSLQANNILKQKNAELIEQIATLKQAHASAVVEKEQLKREFQTITSPTRKRHEDVHPTPSRQTARQKRAETQSINNRKTGRVKELRSRSCLQSERNLTLRQTRSQSRLAKQG